MSSTHIFIAIGYQKTGSTWLDRNLLEHPRSGFLRLPTRPLRQLIVGPNPLEFNVEACRAQVQAYLPPTPYSKVPVIGMERLSGNPHSGGYDSKEIAERLVALFPDAKILIVIREQGRMILSTYNQYVRGGGSCNLREYLIKPQPARYAVPSFDFGRFEYHRLINYYVQLFGQSNILVLPYEMFQTTPHLYIQRILDFNNLNQHATIIDELPFEQRIRPSLSWLSIALLRRLNPLITERTQLTPHVLLPTHVSCQRLERFFYRLESKLPSNFIKKDNQRRQHQLMAQVTEYIGHRYDESNAMVAQQIGVDLGGYGYALSHNVQDK